ncbi:hypothetical protein MNBD_GAMMA16-1656 [hydrothermal vent metagenome]|uniref:PilZ domain-containing protein n=1 Tax=hydrothermal vent metagenome TaxID=652676 RepID=A0A3B0ZCW9_9ZZZZ
MGIERRKDERKPFLMENFKGTFFIIESDNKCSEVTQVQDVSISGIGLDIKGGNYEPGYKLDLVFETEGLRISIVSVVRWVDKHEEKDFYRVGLEFATGQGDMTLLFFMALRTYLDSFDAVRHEGVAAIRP